MFMMEYVDNAFKKALSNTDIIANEFSNYLKNIESNDFIEKLIFTWYIPDLYISDSSEETLFTKLVEVMTAERARRMWFESEYVKQKASYQDVNIKIEWKIIVCDSKSFRLWRSQAAPNVKDFLKLADIEKWLSRYDKDTRLWWLVVYPCKHEWEKWSDAYQYCSSKEIPTVMLPYKYLALLLYYSWEYDTSKLKELWDYERIFPNQLKDKKNNKTTYRNKINTELMRITWITPKKFFDFINISDKIINNYIVYNKVFLENLIQSIKEKKKMELDKMDKEKLEEILLEYMIKSETSQIESSLKNLIRFRL